MDISNILVLSLNLITNSVTNATGITPTFGDGSTGQLQQVITAIGGQVVIGFKHEGQSVPLGGPISFLLSVKTNHIVGHARSEAMELPPPPPTMRRGTNNATPSQIR